MKCFCKNVFYVSVAKKVNPDICLSLSCRKCNSFATPCQKLYFARGQMAREDHLKSYSSTGTGNILHLYTIYQYITIVKCVSASISLQKCCLNVASVNWPNLKTGIRRALRCMNFDEVCQHWSCTMGPYGHRVDSCLFQNSLLNIAPTPAVERGEPLILQLLQTLLWSTIWEICELGPSMICHEKNWLKWMKRALVHVLLNLKHQINGLVLMVCPVSPRQAKSGPVVLISIWPV